MIVLACENEDEFQEMLADYAATYRPGSPVEVGLVDEMVACRWRMQRLRVIETALIDSEMDREPAAAETQVDTDDPGHRLAFAFRRLVDESRAISLASRYESRLHRMHERCHSTLRELQQTRREQTAEPVSSAPVQPEPGPELVVEDVRPGSAAAAEPSEQGKKLRNEPTPPSFARVRKESGADDRFSSSASPGQPVNI